MVLAVIVSVSSLALCVLIALQSSKASAKAFQLVDSMHARNKEQLDQVLDRLMAMDFQTFKLWQSTESDEGNGFFPPAEPPEEEIVPKQPFPLSLRSIRDEVPDEEELAE